MNLQALFWSGSDLLVALQMVVSVYLGARSVLAGELTLGSYLAIIAMVGQFMWPVRNLGQVITKVSTGWVSYARIMAVVRQEREGGGRTGRPPAPAHGGRGSLRACGVCLRSGRQGRRTGGTRRNRSCPRGA